MKISRFEATKIVWASVFISALAVFAGNVSAATVDPDGDGRKFAYGEAVDWINFNPGFDSGVTVTETAVTGYAWCDTAGWINLSPESHGGVTHDGEGNLSGWAWSESAGWISFSCENTDTCGEVDYVVKIDLSDGVFEGYAWSDAVGWINFNLASTDYAANGAKTAWDHAISGNAGEVGAVLSYEDGVVKEATAGDGGVYSFTVSYGWSGTVTPSKTGYDFAPPSRTYTEVTTDQTGQDYAATPTNWTATPSAGDNGAIDPDTPQAVVHGDTAVFAITPAENYRVQTPVGGTCGGSYTGNPADSTNGIVYTTDPVEGDCTVAAAFARAVPYATTQAASSVGETTATLNGVVDPNGLATIAWFEWGTDDDPYANRLPELPDPGYDKGSSEGSAPIGDFLAGLTASTTYHYRAVAQNSAGTAYGDCQTFDTGDIDSTCGEHWPTKIEDGSEYELLSEAVANAQDGDAVLLGRTHVDEDAKIEMEDTAILLQGGWSCDFGSRTDTDSTIRGSLTVEKGTAVVDGIVLSGAVAPN